MKGPVPDSKPMHTGIKATLLKECETLFLIKVAFNLY